MAPPPRCTDSRTSSGSISTGSFRWIDTRAGPPPSVAVYSAAPNRAVYSGRTWSTNSIVSYGPHSPRATPDGSGPKSIRRPSPDSLSPSGIARMEKDASLWPAANVTLAGMRGV